MSQLKKRTVAYPHRVFKKVSIYLIKQSYIEENSFTGYKGSFTDDSGTTISIESVSEVNPFDGKIFDYVVSRIQASKNEDLSITFDTKELLEEIGISNRSENRNKIYDSLIKLVSAKVTMSWNNGRLVFTMLDSVEMIDGTITLKAILSDSYIKAMKDARKRYLSIDILLKSKSKYTMELFRVLQMYGRGVDKRNGKAIPVKEIAYKETTAQPQRPIQS